MRTAPTLAMSASVLNSEAFFPSASPVGGGVARGTVGPTGSVSVVRSDRWVFTPGFGSYGGAVIVGRGGGVVIGDPGGAGEPGSAAAGDRAGPAPAVTGLAGGAVDAGAVDAVEVDELAPLVDGGAVATGGGGVDVVAGITTRMRPRIEPWISQW